MTTRDFADSLYNLWIIEKTSSICIFAQEFTQLPVKINEDLAGGFFSAIHMFSKEATGQSIKYMELDEICFHFHDMERLYFVLVTAKNADREEIHAFFITMQQRFESRFKVQLEKGSFNDVSVFSSFATEAEEELGKKGTFQSLFELPADLIKERYEVARKRMLSMKKNLFDAGFDIVKSISNLGVIQHVLKKGKARRDSSNREEANSSSAQHDD
jgi:hypothetical protein